MTNQHPITPPPELVDQWREETCPFFHLGGINDLATQSAQWGWDQRGTANEAELQEARDEELKACREWLEERNFFTLAEAICNDRRPKPPTLKEQALKTVDEMSFCMSAGFIPKRSSLDAIRRALEALPND
jgi:hypothetical protein